MTRTERIFTKQQPPPSWEAPQPAALGEVLFFGVGGFLTRAEPLAASSFAVKLAGADQMAVIVWPVQK